jgi:hypothetical protein
MVTPRKPGSSGRAADDTVEELCFEDGIPPRTGDPSTPEERAQVPPQRERDAGLSAGETVDGNLTDDDLSPETLLDEEEEYDIYAEEPADKSLHIASGDEIGAGFGRDEAELARDEHPDR